jgi:hypothetical protein
MKIAFLFHCKNRKSNVNIMDNVLPFAVHQYIFVFVQILSYVYTDWKVVPIYK